MSLPSDYEELTIDDARDFLYTSLRACERYAKNLQALVDDLNTKKNQDPWLESVTDECLKGTNFHEQQLAQWQLFSGKMEAYVAAVRREADELAIDELSLSKVDEEGNPRPQKESKFVHPELAKFKLEKQARILGKYGGVPALGAGLVMHRPPRESILRATASPAAVEIQYSRVEGKDAPELAQVMQFKARRTESEQAEWQKEVHERRRTLEHDVAEEDVDPLSRNTSISAAAASPYAGELTEKLRRRQVQVQEAQATAQAAEKAGEVDELAAATPELASRLQHRKASLAAEEAAIRAAQEEQQEPSTPPPATWSNPGVAFGGELASVLQRRGMTPAATSTPSTASAYATPPSTMQRPPAAGGRTPMAGAVPVGPAMSPELAAVLQRRRSQAPES